MNLKTLIKVIVLLSTTLNLQAKNNDTQNIEQLTSPATYVSYVRMSTEELQETLEILSINGEHNLDMGLELIKRWTAES